ncbi:G protein-coupled glucose receptor regulating Gpa2-domain-containing protein [Echria macrotheca]|uniref:G protein-coupled glucose receptor regulating Gpa2-domain-containing protein n=1 Tax=Echria macrotheca TaxID=438768 RepID=A0AAJ0B8S2_9PEZI|nr:G protein-coupled glucose receptor regulating Gpa2-domain-containing protein [Echria macrotheca]
MILSLTFASISVAATVLTFYWFIKMRRSFRHDLIMLLIQSDCIKSAAFVIFPIVSLARGNVQSDSVFCQVSGFWLAVGIESSDIAVVLIALHSVMYIFRPRSGLYPYRRLAYSIYYLFPVLTASLAFIDGSGYENLGHYCYLRTDQGWRRMALSWIPRYVIGASIMIIYVFIYIYIRKRMDDYGRRSSGSLEQSRANRLGPALPKISYHGLLPSGSTSRQASTSGSGVAAKLRQKSSSSTSSVWAAGNNAAANSVQMHGISMDKQTADWNWAGFSQPRSSVDDPFPDDAVDPLAPDLSPVTPPAPDSKTSSGTSGQTFWRRPVSLGGPRQTGADHALPRRANVSLPNILTMLRTGPSPPGSPSGLTKPRSKIPSTRQQAPSVAVTASTSTPVPSSVLDDAPGAARANRDKIRRQLRSLFAYPLVYLIVWLFPFISHVMGYDDVVRPDDPSWLLILGIISLCVQGTVDCGLFTLRERPWRHAARADLGFWKALVRRFAVHWTEHTKEHSGRTREEMMVDGMLARERRDEEIVLERARRSSAEHGAGHGGITTKKETRQWWDVQEEAWYWEDDSLENDESGEDIRRRGRGRWRGGPRGSRA